MGNRCADHVTPLYPQKLALTSPTGGGRSVGIVRSRTKATEFSLILVINNVLVFCSGDMWFEFQTGFQLASLSFFGFLRYLKAKSSISFSLPPLPFQFISYPTIYDIQSALLTFMHQITHKTRFIIHNVTV